MSFIRWPTAIPWVKLQKYPLFNGRMSWDDFAFGLGMLGLIKPVCRH